MINYIVQVLLFQTVFLAVYDLVLKKETFFQWNRAYLLVTSMLAYIIPGIRFSGVSENIPQEYRIMLPEVVLSPGTYIENQVNSPDELFTGIQWLFILGGTISALIFIYKIVQIFKLIRFNRKEKKKDYSLVILQDQHTSFSFFRYIFLGNNHAEKDQIIAHELVHVKQKHSIDLVFFEIQKIILWFNPYSYIYQNRIAEIHEFIADVQTVNKKEKSTFYNSLLAETFRVDKMAFVNSYNRQTIIKKRIIMLTKKKSKEILKFKYLLLIPVLLGMLIYTSCENTGTDSATSMVNKKRLVKFITEGYTKKDGTLVEKKVIQTDFEGYFDLYNGISLEGKEIPISNLSDEEKLEYQNVVNMTLDKSKVEFKIIELENGNRMIQQMIDFSEREKNRNGKDYSNASEVPFGQIDQVPIFPGCEDAKDQKACLVQKIADHVSANFDMKIGKNLGLEKGTKRVYVQFKIDKAGKIVDIRSRGPHKDLEEEAIRVISILPQMIPGEENGRKVGVKYTLPITFVVD